MDGSGGAVQSRCVAVADNRRTQTNMCTPTCDTSLIHGLATCPTAVILVDGTQLYTPVSCLHLFQKKANCTRSRAFEGKSLGGKSFGGKH